MIGTGAQRPSENILLVEGQDDKHVVRHLCDRSQEMPEFFTLDRVGLSQLLPAIGPEIKVSGRQAVGIVVDANSNLRSRWDEVVGRLEEVGIQPPDNPDPAGTIISGTPRIGIWVMPNNQSTGELEDFIQKMIPVEDPVWPMSNDYIEGIPNADRKFSGSKILKAKLYAWLATRKKPGRMGAAIGAGDLLVDNELSNTFVAWLRRLFG